MEFTPRDERGVHGGGERGVHTERPNRTTHKKDIQTAGSFDEFWRVYPSRKPHSNPKVPAKKKYEAAVRSGVAPADIIRGAKNYALFVEHERLSLKYICQAQTWLSQERWSEYQEAVESDSGPLML